MYILMVMRTSDGAASFYGPFDDRASANRWYLGHTDSVTGVTHAVYPLLSTSRDRRRGQLAKMSAAADTGDGNT